MSLLFFAAALFLAAVPWARATSEGTSNVTCPTRYDWAKNSLGQNPCLVAAILVAAPTCFDDEYNIDPLANGSTYAGTGGVQAPCVCNDVVYSLFTACADCQGASFATFKDFTGTCNKTFTSYQGTVPPSTEVPSWAQMNVEVAGNFDPTAAQDFASQAASASSSSSVASASSASVASASSASVLSVLSVSASEHSTALPASITPSPTGGPTGSAPSAGSDRAGAVGATSISHAGPIAGGILGTLLLLGALALGGWFWRRRRRAQPEIEAPPLPPPPPPEMARLAAPQRLYDPADPTTFPPPAPSSYAAPTIRSQQHGSPNSFATLSPTPGMHVQAGMYGYTGIPEV